MDGWMGMDGSAMGVVVGYIHTGGKQEMEHSRHGWELLHGHWLDVWHVLFDVEGVVRRQSRRFSASYLFIFDTQK